MQRLPLIHVPNPRFYCTPDQSLSMSVKLSHLTNNSFPYTRCCSLLERSKPGKVLRLQFVCSREIVEGYNVL